MAGGKGTRLRPLTNNVPKPLIQILDKKAIEYIVDTLARAGIDGIIITSCYKFDTLVDFLGDGCHHGVQALYSIEPQPMGTAGGVKKLEQYLDDTFVVGSADVIADFDLKKVIEFHKDSGAIATLALTEVENPTEFGIVGLDDKGRIQKFKEKPKPEEVFSNLINAGIYILEPEIFDYIPADTKYDFSKDLFPSLLEAGEPLFGCQIDGLWIDIGRPLDLLKATKAMMQRNGKKVEGQIASSAKLGDHIYIEKGAVVHEAAEIVDSAIFSGALVGAGAKVINSVVYPQAVIEGETKVTNSIIMSGARASGTIDDTIIE
jgi:mannose-1-phosphate guanylyltransferase